jgi:hypothetical protein
MGIVAVSYEDAPERWEDRPDINDEVWPEYNQHGDVLNRYWRRLYDEAAGYQFMLFDRGLGRGSRRGPHDPLCSGRKRGRAGR